LNYTKISTFILLLYDIMINIFVADKGDII